MAELNTKIGSYVYDEIVRVYPERTAFDRELKGRALALCCAVDRQTSWMLDIGWGLHLLNSLPAGAVPSQGQCLALRKATETLPGRVWNDDVRAFGKFYIDNGFFDREAEKMVGFDQLLFRTVAEEQYAMTTPATPSASTLGGNYSVANTNWLLHGLLLT